MSSLPQISPPVKGGPIGVRAQVAPNASGGNVLKFDKGPRNSASEWAPMIPASVAFDPRLSPLQVRLALAVASFTAMNGECWPSNEALAEKCHCSARQVRRDLAALEGFGLLERRKDADRKRGEVLIPRWAGIPPQGEDAHVLPPGRPCPPPPDAHVRHGGTPVSPKESEGITRTEQALRYGHGNDTPLSSGTEEEPAPAEPQSLTEAISALPGGTAADIDVVAVWSASDLGDHASIGAYRKRAKMVADGVFPPSKYLGALKAGLDAKAGGRVTRPGAIFMKAWKTPVRLTEDEAAARRKQAESAVRDAAARAEYMQRRRERIEEFRRWTVLNQIDRARSEYQVTVGLTAEGTLAFGTARYDGQTDHEVIGILKAREPEVIAALKADSERKAGLCSPATSRRLFGTTAPTRQSAPAVGGVA